MEKKQLLELVKKASNGDEEAFEQILRVKSRHILYNAYDFVGNHQDAEDAAQDIVVTMYENIGKLRDPENFSSWLHRIIHNVCISMLRKKKFYNNDFDVEAIMETGFGEALIEKDKEFLPHAFAEEDALSSLLIKSIRELPRRRRRALLLYYYEDLSQKEIAEIMNISESTVASNIARAKKDLKSKLEEKTGMDFDAEIKASAGKYAAIPVLGEVIRADAVTQFGAESVAKLANFDFKSASENSSKSGNNSYILGLKVAAIVTAAGVVCGSAFMAADNPADTKPAEQAPPVKVEKEIEPALSESGEITFSGGVCDCGHENPKGITLNYNGSESLDDVKYEWEITNESGAVVDSGQGTDISSPNQLASGTYTARFLLTDTNDNVLVVEREFENK